MPKSLNNCVIEHTHYVPCTSFEEKCAQTRTFPIYHSLWGEIHFLSTDMNRIYLILRTFFIFLNMKTRNVLVSAIFRHISLLRLLPKSYFKISTFQPNFLCFSYFNITNYSWCLVPVWRLWKVAPCYIMEWTCMLCTFENWVPLML